jgi:hypothetical protein
MLKNICKAALFLLAFGTVGAQANVIYNFNGQITGAKNGPFTSTLVVTDAAFNAGFLDFRISGLFCNTAGPNFCSVTGDPSGFVSFTDNQNYIENLSSTTATGTLDIDFTFGPGGTVFGSFDIFGSDQDLHFIADGGGFSGTFTSDSSRCTTETLCFVAGTIPEPQTYLVFLAGLAGLAAARRRVLKPA